MCSRAKARFSHCSDSGDAKVVWGEGNPRKEDTTNRSVTRHVNLSALFIVGPERYVEYRKKHESAAAPATDHISIVM